MTDRPANNVDAKQREMYALADGLLSGTITADEAKHLDELLCNDAEARRYYAQFIYDSATFWHWNSANAVQEGDQVVPEEVADGHQTNVGWRTIIDESAEETTAGGTTPRVYASSFILHPFLSGTLLSYVTAVLLLGVCVFATWAWGTHGGPVTTPAVAMVPPNTSPSQEINGRGKAERPWIGKFATLTACTWRGPQTVASRAADGTVDLVSGTVELTYYTGVKVVIEGPALYVAESRDGGYLKVGKLTVYLNQPSEPRSGKPASTYGGQPSPLAGKPQPQTPAAEPPLFTIRTPNADFASRDAEFTVSGDPSGGCWAQVARGCVELTPRCYEAQKPFLMHQGQLALLQVNGQGALDLMVGKGEIPAIFASKMPKGSQGYSLEAPREKTRQQEKKGVFTIGGSSPDS